METVAVIAVMLVVIFIAIITSVPDINNPGDWE